MIGYFKPVEGGEWQPLGDVTSNTLYVEGPMPHSEPPLPQKASISFTLPANAMANELKKLFRPYPKLPRKLKKEIKSFRKLIGLPYKKCSRQALLKTYCVLWLFGPGHDVNPGWLTRAGWKIKKGGVTEN